MPEYGEDDTPETVGKKKESCSGLREDLKACLLKSDCYLKDKRSLKECFKARDDPSVPQECYSLRAALFYCKRQQLDMRTRFRGQKGY